MHTNSVNHINHINYINHSITITTIQINDLHDSHHINQLMITDETNDIKWHSWGQLDSKCCRWPWKRQDPPGWSVHAFAASPIDWPMLVLLFQVFPKLLHDFTLTPGKQHFNTLLQSLKLKLPCNHINNSDGKLSFLVCVNHFDPPVGGMHDGWLPK